VFGFVDCGVTIIVFCVGVVEGSVDCAAVCSEDTGAVVAGEEACTVDCAAVCPEDTGAAAAGEEACTAEACTAAVLTVSNAIEEAGEVAGTTIAVIAVVIGVFGATVRTEAQRGQGGWEGWESAGQEGTGHKRGSGLPDEPAAEAADAREEARMAAELAAVPEGLMLLSTLATEEA